MREDKHMIDRGIAQGAHQSQPLSDMARSGLVSFLREQIVDAEWEIARAKAELAAYETAIAHIEEKRAAEPTMRSV